MAPRAPALAAGASAVAAIGTYFWARPTYSSVATPHDPITAEQCCLVRAAPSGESVPPAWNPGARTNADFLPEAEAQELLAEVRPIMDHYGISLIQPVHAAIYRWQMGYLPLPPPVNMLRVTGRPEHPQQRRPWGYGDAMDEQQLPPGLRRVVARIRAIPGLRLGPLRDVTLNRRHSSFLRLDPHIDPAADGDDIFILSLDGTAVLTLSPARWYDAGRLLAALTAADEREVVRADSERSWTRYDVDVLLPPRALLHLSGDARWRWNHGTRLGVPPPPPPVQQQQQGGQQQQQPPQVQATGAKEAAAGTSGPQKASASASAVAGGDASPGQLLVHWWGRPDAIVGPTPERTSVVFAFGAPD